MRRLLRCELFKLQFSKRALIGCLCRVQLLAKKVYTLYSLAVQQLSKQDHYDFGLRALVSVLRYAGRKKRANPTMADEEVSVRASRQCVSCSVAVSTTHQQ